MLRRITLSLLALVAAFAPAGCAPSGRPTSTLLVFAAASLTDALNDIGPAFTQAHPGVSVSFSFGGSQLLRSQIQAGARADVFASADLANMEALQQNGLVQGEARILARNKLAVILPLANPAGIHELKDLARPNVKLDLADPSVPAGNYALQVLDKLSADPAFGADFKGRVLARVVSRENNVRQVVTKVSLGEADAGIVYDTDARSAADKLAVIAIPGPYNVLAAYPIAALKSSASPDLAKQFVDFVVSGQGQAILSKYGFSAP